MMPVSRPDANGLIRLAKLLMILGFLTLCFQTASAQSRTELVDLRSQLNPRYVKIPRAATRHIIVHTSELGLEATLRVVSKGKQFPTGRTTPGGHAHYVIARNGTAYRILDHQFIADHAGLSMWNGVSDISRFSVGIELVGYHHADISDAQYRSLGSLLKTLQKTYGLKDRDVLTHSQIAYGRPNPWFSKNHRGRKRCAKNFERARAGLGPTWAYDPDVRAGRLTSDPMLAEVFYGGRKSAAPSMPASVPQGIAVAKPAKALPVQSDVISKENTAWSIAGEDYNDPGTVYLLPGGKTLTGDKVEAILGWSRVPVGTRVLLNQGVQSVQSVPDVQAGNPVKTITGQMSAWSHAGPAYNQDTTIYFLPSGKRLPGSRIKDWDDLPAGTRLLVGYKGPFTMAKGQTAFGIAGHQYRKRSVIYLLPGKGLTTGDQISDFSNLPRGVVLYLPLGAQKG